MPAKWSGQNLLSKDAKPEERRFAFVQQILLPGLSTLSVMFAVEFVKDKPTLFFTILLISFGFVMLSYGIVKFEPLKNQAGKRAFLTKMLYILINSIIYTLAIVVILNQFLFGKDLPYFALDYENQVLSIYLQKLYVTFFVMFVSWITTFLIAKLVFK